MANVAINTFNAGELSPNLDCRSDVEKYSSGCRTMENFLPLVQGAATRRPGTEYIATAKNTPDSVRLIPFIYSASVAYVCEFGEQYIRFYYDGAILADAGGTVVEVATPYQSADLKSLHYKQVGDVMWLVHPAYPPAKLTRTSATAFSLTNIVFETGPFMTRNDLKNDNGVTLTCSVVSVGETGTLTASADTFYSGHEGSLWKLTETRREMSVSEKLTSVRTGASINLKGSFAFETSGTWVGTVLLERNVDEEGWDVFRTYVHDAGTDANASYAGTEDDENVQYRVRVSAYTSGTIYTTISSNASTIEGVVRINGILSATVATVTVVAPLAYATAKAITGINKNANCVVTCPGHGLADGDPITITGVVGMIEVNDLSFTVGPVTTNTFRLRDAADAAAVDSSGYTAYTSGGYVNGFRGAINTVTTRWAEGSWSGVRGYPSAITFYENRCVYGGTTGQPQTIWLSATDDYENFESGVKDADSFELTMAATNRIRWLESLEALGLGTAADEWRIMSNRLGQALTPTNFNIRQQTTYGSDSMQTVRADQAVLFLDYVARKVREFTYRADADQYVAPDLTALADHVTEGGIVSMALQRNPDTILWCFRGDGTLLSMTYDRTQNVIAWARHTMGDTHTVTGAGGGSAGGAEDQPEAPAETTDTTAEEDYGVNGTVPTSCPLTVGAVWDAVMTTPFPTDEGLYYRYHIVGYADATFEVSGEAGLKDDGGATYWEGIFKGTAADAACWWNCDFGAGTRCDAKQIGYGAGGGVAAQGGISLQTGYWQVEITFNIPDDSGWLSGWTGTKTTGSTPVGRYTRTGGLSPTPVYIDIEAMA